MRLTQNNKNNIIYLNNNEKKYRKYEKIKRCKIL